MRSGDKKGYLGEWEWDIKWIKEDRYSKKDMRIEYEYIGDEFKRMVDVDRRRILEETSRVRG
jgi:hypothetical protein